jgi:hypothetical protein
MVGFNELFCGKLFFDTFFEIHALMQNSGNLNEIIIYLPIKDNVLASLYPK